MTIKNQKQNAVLKNANTNISLKFGFLGLGMGGTSIASACADIQTSIQNNRYPYTSLLINTNKIDLEKVEQNNPNTKKLIIGDGRGAGRQIKSGEKMFQESNEEIIDHVKKQFEDRDFVWVVAGLGGGTGTGSVIEAIKVIMQNGFKNKFGLILTLPRVNEGQTVLSNALERLERIHKAMSGLGSIILVDNQKLYDYFKEHKPSSSIGEYLQFSNQFVAETLHELNVVTSSFKPVGENHFDSSEFENLVKTPGVLHFARFTSKSHEIDTAQSVSHIGKLKEHIDAGVLSDGYDLTNTSRLAVSILANQNTANRLFNFQFDSAIEEDINSIAPFANEKPIAQYIYENRDTSDVYFYAVFAGLQLPKRAEELVNELASLIEKKKNKQSENKDIFAALSAPTETTNSNKELSFEDLFGDSPSEPEEKEVSNEEKLNAFFSK